jgi:uncharacterized protein GlcG (DUF336 family)
MTLAAAEAIIEAAKTKARAIPVAVSCAVVDSGGILVAFERMDGAELVTVVLAEDKAYTALVNQSDTGALAALSQPGAELFGLDSAAGGRMVVFAGGIPLLCDGVLVGAVGVSGGTVVEDQVIAEAGALAFAQN